MDRQLEVRKIINDEITRVKTINPSFSLRALAKKLNVQPSALSEILNGKRLITRKMAEKILERLCVDPEKSNHILSGLSNRAGELQKNGEYTKHVQVNMDHYNVISEWYYFAILSLAETEEFQDDPSWIAKRLNIKVIEATKALERLERLDLLVRNKSGHLETTGQQFSTSTDIANISLRKSHHQNLDLARRSLDEDPVDLRDFSSMTMAIDPEKIPEAKMMIKNFRRKLNVFMESGRKSEVYRICVQLFPLTRQGESK